MILCWIVSESSVFFFHLAIDILHQYYQDCDGLTGECKCDKNYDGQACGAYCPNECSDHGTCNAKVCTVDIAKENIPQAVLEDIHQETQVPVEDIDCSLIAFGDWLCCHSSNGQQVREFCCAMCKDKECPTTTTESVNVTGKCCSWLLC